MDISEVSFNALLLFEPLQIEYMATLEPDAAMGTALKAHSTIDWYLRQIHPPISDYLDRCLELAKLNASAEEIRQAEIEILERFHDWVVYAVKPENYDKLEFNNWDDGSLLGMADFKHKVVIDIGSGTGRLAFAVAPIANTVYAVEPVANLRRFIWKKREELGMDTVFPLDGSITQIPLPDNFADIVMSGHVFGDQPPEEYTEMERVTRNGGMILLHPGSNAESENEAHEFLVNHGFEYATFEEPGDGKKRKYWKTIRK
jgi:SAM-dependent methyltransferase